MKNIHIRTERLCIREYEPEDLPAHHELISDPSAMIYMQDVFSASFEESRENLLFAIREGEKEQREKFFLVIADGKNGSYMGGIGYEILSRCPLGAQVEIGYFLSPKHRGRGYVSEALRALMEFAFTKGGVYRINGTCITDNIASARVMEACGMIREGERVGIQWHIDSLRSRYLYRLLKDEWLLLPDRKEGKGLMGSGCR